MSVSVRKQCVCEHDDFFAVYLDVRKFLETKPGGTEKVAFVNLMTLLCCIQELGWHSMCSFSIILDPSLRP